ncbi:MAG: hypothetical protein PWQ57_33 [Desulfovibrionales bacterium]|nr:hypothetical protein [Desulfovibrionales bacterium]
MQSYPVPMRGAVKLAYFCAVAVTAAVAAWCFRAGFMWSGIFLTAVAGPFAVLYWYMLSVNPARTEIQVLDDGFRITAPPFVDTAVLFSDMEQVFESDLSDPALSFKKHNRAMRFGGYVAGVFELKDGTEAIAVSNKKQVVCVRTPQRMLILGPDRVHELAIELAARMG